MAHPNHAIVAETVRMRQRQDHLEARLNSVQGRPPTDAELRAAADYHEVVDPIYRDLGLSRAPGMLDNESYNGYRRRIVGQLQKYAAPKMREVSIARATPDVFPIWEKEILTDAIKLAADRTWTDKPGTLREIRRADAAGRENIEFAGDPLTTWAMFMSPTQFLVRVIDPQTGRDMMARRTG